MRPLDTLCRKESKMKVDVRLSVDGELYVEISKFAHRESIQDKEAIRWLIQEGLKSFNGIAGQTKLSDARVSRQSRKE